MKKIYAILVVGLVLISSCKKDKESKKEEEKSGNTPPSVSFISLESKTYYIQEPDTIIKLAVNATDANGSITNVKFYINNIFLESVATSPYCVNHLFYYNEEYSITAVAYDNHGDSSVALVAFTLKPTEINPVITFIFPAENSIGVHGADTTLTLEAEASDENGSVAKVKFYIDDAYIGEDLSSPYNINYTFTKGNTYNIRAEAIDNDNNTTTASRSYSITEPVFHPTASFTVDGTTYTPTSISCVRNTNLFVVALSMADSYPSISLKLSTTGSAGTIHSDSTSTASYGIVNMAAGATNAYNSYYSGYGDFIITTLTTDHLAGTFTFYGKNSGRTDAKSVTGSFNVMY